MSNNLDSSSRPSISVSRPLKEAWLQRPETQQVLQRLSEQNAGLLQALQTAAIDPSKDDRFVRVLSIQQATLTKAIESISHV